MPSASRVHVDIIANAAQFRKEIARTQKDFRRFGREMQSQGRELTRNLTLPIVALGAATFKMAADAAESASKIEAVFGEATRDMNRWVSELRDTVPETTANLQEYSASIGAMLVPLEMSTAASMRMTQGVVQLAADLASLNNVPIAEALDKLRAGLVGEAEPLRVWGVQLSAAKAKAKALELGLIEQGDALSDTAKIMANWQIILDETTVAQGDAARTADSAANQMKRFWSELQETAVVIGDELLPVVTPLVSDLSDMVRGIQEANASAITFGITFAGLTATLGPLLLGLGKLATWLGTLTPAGLALRGAFFGVVTAVSTYASHQRQLNEEIREAAELLRDTEEALAGYRNELSGMSREALEAERAQLALQETLLLGQRAQAFHGIEDAEGLPTGPGTRTQERNAAMKEANTLFAELGVELENVQERAEEVERALGNLVDPAGGGGAGDLTDEFTKQVDALSDEIALLEDAAGLSLDWFQVWQDALVVQEKLLELQRKGLETREQEVAVARALRDVSRVIFETGSPTRLVHDVGEAFARDLGGSLDEVIERMSKFRGEIEGANDDATQGARDWSGAWVAGIASAGNALGGFAQDLAGIAIGGLAGGPIGAGAAGIGALFSAFSFGANERSFRTVQREWQGALADFVEGLRPPEGLDAVAKRYAAELDQLFTDALSVVIKDSSLGSLVDRTSIRRSLLDAFESGGLDAAMARARELGVDFSELAEAMRLSEERLRELADAEAERSAAAEEALRIQEEAAQVAREVNQAFFDQETAARELTLAGQDRAAREAELQLQMDRTLQALQEEVAAGELTEESYRRRAAVLRNEMNTALEEFEQAARDAAAAERDATAAKQFAEEQSMRELEIRLAIAQGNAEQAEMLEDLAELEAALHEQRNEEFIALLELVQAEEARKRLLEAEARAAREIASSTFSSSGRAASTVSAATAAVRSVSSSEANDLIAINRSQLIVLGAIERNTRRGGGGSLRISELGERFSDDVDRQNRVSGLAGVPR